MPVPQRAIEPESLSAIYQLSGNPAYMCHFQEHQSWPAFPALAWQALACRINVIIRMIRMKILLILLLVLPALAAPALAQGNWPYHRDTVRTSGDCSCGFHLGFEVGTPLLTSWSQTESFNPPVAGSPLYVFESKNIAPFLPLGFYLGLGLDIPLGRDWRMELRGGYAMERFKADDRDADVDVLSTGGQPVLGGVAQSNAHGTIGYVETSVALDRYVTDALFVFAGLAARTATGDLDLSWDETIKSPAGAVFVGSTTSTTRPQGYSITNVRRARYGPMFGAGYRMQASQGIAIVGQLIVNYWLAPVAGDEDRTDASRALTSGTSQAHLSGRDLQNYLNLRLGLSFDL